ncbi:MAG: flagellar hook-basal body complex protein FliE [Burkholderiales bacterium]|nr:flagellar hook-basal body complex protein FliE [Burkholderiales bacterium]MBP6250265.1 flagellar hook-basal body complex protein FliE [Leptothrix sp. (in: b-proteobacteria)]
MDVRLKPFDFAQAAAKAGMPQVAQEVRIARTQASSGLSRSDEGGPTGTSNNFSVALSQALRSVSQAQMQAQQLQREVSLDNPQVSIEQTMLAMQKSQIGFQAALQVRNRLVQAYSDIMNMQV